jgi:hypothetical protein
MASWSRCVADCPLYELQNHCLKTSPGPFHLKNCGWPPAVYTVLEDTERQNNTELWEIQPSVELAARRSRVLQDASTEMPELWSWCKGEWRVTSLTATERAGWMVTWRKKDSELGKRFWEEVTHSVWQAWGVHRLGELLDVTLGALRGASNGKGDPFTLWGTVVQGRE